MKKRNALTVATLTLCALTLNTPKGFSQVHLSEGFETGSKPTGWTEETVSGNEPWRYRNGGHSPNDSNWDKPADQIDITRNPPAAYEGTYNAIFFKQSYNNERTKLVTPELDLLGASSLELSFYLCQIPWTFAGATGWDILRIYYKVSEEDDWVLIKEFLDPVYEWEEQKVYLPNPTETYYVAFEGQTRWGYGTCIDNVVIQETASQPMYIDQIDLQQAFDNYIPSGSPDVPIMRVDFTVFGNSDSVVLDYIHFKSLNTDDNDIEPGAVKLYSTTTQNFSTGNLLGSPTDFNSGLASFTGLNYTLPQGRSYLWLACDVALDAVHENILDALVPASGISANGSQYPSVDQSPPGFRMIYGTRYQEDFEGAHGWTLTQEFEVGSPTGMGGNPGNPDPDEAYRGTKVLGTDLTGLGSYPYNYEPGLVDETADIATSPNINALYYKNLNLFYQRYLNIEWSDSAFIQVSTDDGTTWNTFWTKKDDQLTDYQWGQERIQIPDSYARSDQLKIRFKLGPTDGFGNHSGWNIDDLYLTGEFISKDVGVSEWISPQSGSGHTSADSVKVRIRNYGGAEILNPVPVAYSFDGGAHWTTDLMTQTIPVDGSVVFTFPTTADLSQPGLRPSVLTKTILPGDQYTANDQISTQIYVVPTYIPPYEEDFESGTGSWRSEGVGIWQYGTPNGSTIQGAASGTKSWATGLAVNYGDMISELNQTVFGDDFETNKGWSFVSEFERAVPNIAFLPSFAYGGSYCIGVDLSGQGANFYQYENGITEGSPQTATTPSIPVTSYSNIRVEFESWITIMNGDSIRLEVTPDEGTTWYTLWKNTEGEIVETDWQYRQYIIPDEILTGNTIRVRFSLFHTSAAGEVNQGWSIDDFKLVGDLVDVTPAYLSSPNFDLSGLSNPVITSKFWTETEDGVDGMTLEYSLNDGTSWSPVTNSTGYDSYWNWYKGHPVQALGTDGWSGLTGGWIEFRHLLPAAVVNQDQVLLRFKFAANKTNNLFDGAALDDIRVMEAPVDLDLVDLLDPVTACELSSAQNLTVRITNTGLNALQTGDSIQVGFSIDREGALQTAEETYIMGQNWPAGNTLSLTFGSEFDFSQSGNYQVSVYFIAYDPHFYNAVSNDTLIRTIQVNKPAVELGEDISTVRPDTVILRAYSGVPGQTYLWQDGSSDSVFHVSTNGTYHVKVTNGLECTAYDTVQVLQLVNDIGVSAYLGPQPACEMNDPAYVEVTVENLGTDTLMIGDIIYVGIQISGTGQLEDEIVLANKFVPGSTFDHTYSQAFDFSSPADYDMKLYTRSSKDFVSSNDTLFHTLQVWGYPDASLGPDTVVAASEYLLAPEAGFAEYLWQDGSTGETFTVTEPGLGQYYVTITDVNQCTSQDTVLVNLNVFDLALQELLSPATSCELSESITVSARIRNAGNQAIPSGETVNVAYSINGGAVVEEGKVLSQTLLPGHTFDFTFSSPETVQTGQWYDFEVYVDYTGDSKRTNDTIITSVGVFETPALDLGEDYQEVAGFEYTLDAGSGFISYLWQDGSTGQTYTIEQPGIGRYSVTVTDINGCTAYDEVDVLLAVPDVGISEIVYPVTACSYGEEEHVELAIQNFGNIDIASSDEITVSYSLNGADEVFESLVMTEDFQNGSVLYHTFSQAEDLSEPGTYNLLASVSYASDLVASNNLKLISFEHKGSPVVDIGNGADTMLIDTTVTLSATPGYASYEWQDGSTGTDYTITDPAAGWYSVKVTADNACETVDSVFVVFDRPDVALIAIVSPVSSCDLGSNTVISVEIRNNGFYLISTTDTLSINYSVNSGSSVFDKVHLQEDLSVGESVIVPFTDTYDFSAKGTYQIKATVLYAPDTIYTNNQFIGSIEHWEDPVVTIGDGEDTIVSALPVPLDAGSGFASYLWSDNSTASAVQANNYGWWWVRITDNRGCMGYDSVRVSSLTSDGNIISADDAVRIYPNPAADVLNVAVDLIVDHELRLEIYTISDRLVYRKDLKQAGTREARIDLQGWAPGTYYLRVTTDGKAHHFMVILGDR